MILSQSDLHITDWTKTCCVHRTYRHTHTLTQTNTDTDTDTDRHALVIAATCIMILTPIVHVLVKSTMCGLYVHGLLSTVLM